MKKKNDFAFILFPIPEYLSIFADGIFHRKTAKKTNLMRKLLPLSLAIAASAITAIMASGNSLTFYASMYYNYEWYSETVPNPKYGIYSLDADNGAEFVLRSDIHPSEVTGAAFYLDGKYYTNTMSTYDTDTWQLADAGSGSSIKAIDMTYDYTTSTAYAIKYEGDNNSGNPLVPTVLATVDLATGQPTLIGSDNGCRLKSIAADGSGQLWGIGLPLDVSVPTSLYKIDKITGKATAVHRLDINVSPSAGSPAPATFDLRTGKLYMSGLTYVEDQYLQRTNTYALYEIDTTDGSVTVKAEYRNSELLSGLVMKDCHAKAPDAPTGTEFIFDAGSSSTGKLKCNLPSSAYDGTALTGRLKIEIYIDGALKASKSDLTPGNGFTSDETFTLDAGKAHTIKAVCYNANKGLPATISVYAGTDTPAAPGDMTITPDATGASATITWTAPDKGVNGGYIDTDALTYDVILKPDNITVASDITATSTPYTFSRPMGISQFVVTAKTGDKVSPQAASEVMLLGTPWTLPYLEPFNYSSQAAWPFTTIDANNDASTEYGFQWYYGDTYRAAWYYSTPNAPHGNADDWLITPTVAFEPGSVYRIQFDTYGYMGGTNTLEVTMGPGATPATQSTVILKKVYDTTGTNNASPLNFNTLFVPGSDDRRIGFHNIGDGSDHMFIDNIYIYRYGPASIPGAATNVKAVKHGAEVTLTFNAPSMTAGGQTLTSITKLQVLRDTSDGEVLLSKTDINPGDPVTFTDKTPGSGVQTYIIVAHNADGPGLETIAEINANADVPRAVENLEVTGRNAWTEALLTWNYPESMTGVNGLPLTEQEITYDVYRTIGTKTESIAQNLNATTFTDRECTSAFPDGRQQEYVSYTVVPRTSGGEGESTASASTLMGRAYDMPYHESWTDQRTDTYTWKSANLTAYASWSVAGRGYNPATDGQDGYGLASFSIGRSASSGSGDYISPRIDVSNFANPTVNFYLFQSDDPNTSGAYLQIGISTEDGSSMLATTYQVYSSTPGWKQYSAAIPAEYAGSNRLSIVFHAYTPRYNGCVHIDNVSVTGDQPDHEVKAAGITGPEQCLIGNDNIYQATVANIGAQTATNVKIDFYADDALIGSATIPSLESGTTRSENFTYTPSLNNTERQITLRAEISADNDGSADNNSLETEVALIAPMLPYVTDLSATSVDGQARLTWGEATTYPHVEYLTDNMSAYEAFAIDGAGDWKFIDKDGQPTTAIAISTTGGSQTLDWPNVKAPQAFIVFNPELAGASSIMQARTGSQCFVSFAARQANDDWMVSPRLSGDAQTISFYAKCAHYYFLNEKFEIWASTTDDNLDNFTCISGSKPVAVTDYEQWTRFSYDLPEGTRYFAIRCVSVDQLGLMIDDITYSPIHSPIEMWGFNVYRNGEKITPDPIGDYAFIDSEVEPDKDYTYQVSAIYDAGESIYSNPATVRITPSGIDTIGSDSDATGVTIRPIIGGVAIANADGLLIRIYTTDGRQLFGITGTGNDSIPLAPGIYVVQAGQTTAKIAVR